MTISHSYPECGGASSSSTTPALAASLVAPATHSTSCRGWIRGYHEAEGILSSWGVLRGDRVPR